MEVRLRYLHRLDGHGPVIFIKDDLVHLGVATYVQVGVDSSCRVDVAVGTVASTTSLGAFLSAHVHATRQQSAHIAIDPLKPMLSTMAGLEVLKIVNNRDALRLSCSEEVLCDRVGTEHG